MTYPDTYLYPVVFTYEADGQIAITFPDLPGCVSCADDETSALRSAREALGGHLWCMEQDGDPMPTPTPLLQIPLEVNERVMLLDVFMPSLRLAKGNRSVNRTVTLPAWLNAAAMERKVNFSQVLQQALLQQIQPHT